MEITCYWEMMLDSSVIFTSPAAKRFPNTGVNITNTLNFLLVREQQTTFVKIHTEHNIL